MGVIATRYKKDANGCSSAAVFGDDGVLQGVHIHSSKRLYSRDGTGSHFVTQRPSDSGIQRPGDPVDPVTLFYNELQMSTYVSISILKPKNF